MKEKSKEERIVDGANLFNRLMEARKDKRIEGTDIRYVVLTGEQSIDLYFWAIYKEHLDISAGGVGKILGLEIIEGEQKILRLDSVTTVTPPLTNPN